VPLTFRWTPSGRVKQRLDEQAGWTRLVAAVNGTPSQASVAAATHPGGAPNKHHANYAQWRDAHRVMTRRARQERQRQQQIAAAGPPVLGNVLPCHVDPALVVRQTIQIAIMREPTSEVTGTLIGAATGRSPAQLLAHLREVLGALEEELVVRARHQEAQDLTINGTPPFKLIVASEWYFRPPGRAYTIAEKNAIVTGVEAVSRAFPDWLMVPGSIYWSPDPPAQPIVRVYNQAVVLFAGNVIQTRTKRNEHDIPVQTVDHETWGMNFPAVLPPGIAPASLQPAIFAHAGRDYCVDICRDHFVGEGACGFAATAPASPGAHVYVVTSNNTAITPEFVAARHNGILVHCDGGTTTWVVNRVTRGTGLNALNAQLLAYQVAFAAQRAPGLTYSDALIRVANDRLDPAYLTFMPRYQATMALPADPTTVNVQNALALAGAAHNLNADTQQAFRITRVLGPPALAVGGAVATPAEGIAMTTYAGHLGTQGTSLSQWQALLGPASATGVAKNALIAAVTGGAPGAVVLAAQAALAHQPHPRARLFPLLDI
jgi:hypothetical protein